MNTGFWRTRHSLSEHPRDDILLYTTAVLFLLPTPTNRRAYVLPRQLAMYIARQLTGASLQEIGREFGNRHHSTVLHSIDRIEAMRRTDEALNRTITRLMSSVVAQA